MNRFVTKLSKIFKLFQVQKKLASVLKIPDVVFPEISEKFLGARDPIFIRLWKQYVTPKNTAFVLTLIR